MPQHIFENPMDKSETIAALAKALAQAQGKIEGAMKDKANPAFRSKYADLGAVTDAIKTPLAEHGLSYIQVIHGEENSVGIETVILHESGEWISTGLFSIPVTKRDAHGTMSALTYCRRGSLAAAFGVAPEDDDGNGAASAPPNQAPRAVPPAYINATQRAKIEALLKETGAGLERFLAHYQAESLEKFPASAFEAAIAALNARKSKAEAQAAGSAA